MQYYSVTLLESPLLLILFLFCFYLRGGWSAVHVTPGTQTVSWPTLSRMSCPLLDQTDGGSPGKVGEGKNRETLLWAFQAFNIDSKAMTRNWGRERCNKGPFSPGSQTKTLHFMVFTVFMLNIKQLINYYSFAAQTFCSLFFRMLLFNDLKTVDSELFSHSELPHHQRPLFMIHCAEQAAGNSWESVSEPVL